MVAYEILQEFSGQLNFSLRLFGRFDGQFAKYDPITKQWGGIVRNVIDGEADMIGALIAMDIKRFEVLDYMMPFWSSNWAFWVARGSI